MNNRPLIPLALVFSLLLIGCDPAEENAEETQASNSAEERPSLDPPTREEAAELIKGSQELAQYKFSQAAITIPMRSEMLGDQMREAISDLDRTGWIGFDGEGNVAVTTRAMDDRRFILRRGDTLDIVPVATKRFGEVLEVSTNDAGEPWVDFSWRWEPNEIGASFQSGYFYDRYNRTYYARARLIEGADGWKIYTIESIEPPPGAAAESSQAESEE